MVGIASGSVGLPDLYQASPHRAAVAVQHSSRDDDPLSQRLACVLAGQVVIQLPYRTTPVGRSGRVREGLRKDDQRLLGCPEARRYVVLVQVRRLPVILRAKTDGFIGGSLSHPRISFLAQAGFSRTIALPCPHRHVYYLLPKALLVRRGDGLLVAAEGEAILGRPW